ncbi:hypothetical protein FDG49_18860 [Clostridium botulinum]|nr:hypothetical protein [Clostridium botulinum]
MEWCNDKNKSVNGKEYLVCLDLKNETYSLQYYFNCDCGDIVFKKEGFYFFDTSEDIFKYSRVQPKFWMNIIKPIVL